MKDWAKSNTRWFLVDDGAPLRWYDAPVWQIFEMLGELLVWQEHEAARPRLQWLWMFKWGCSVRRDDDWTPSDKPTATVYLMPSSTVVVGGIGCSRCGLGMQRGQDGHGCENWYCFSCGWQTVIALRQ